MRTAIIFTLNFIQTDKTKANSNTNVYTQPHSIDQTIHTLSMYSETVDIHLVTS